jgi:hypothetical protein
MMCTVLHTVRTVSYINMADKLFATSSKPIFVILFSSLEAPQNPKRTNLILAVMECNVGG